MCLRTLEKKTLGGHRSALLIGFLKEIEYLMKSLEVQSPEVLNNCLPQFIAEAMENHIHPGVSTKSFQDY